MKSDHGRAGVALALALVGCAGLVLLVDLLLSRDDGEFAELRPTASDERSIAGSTSGSSQGDTRQEVAIEPASAVTEDDEPAIAIPSVEPLGIVARPEERVRVPVEQFEAMYSHMNVPELGAQKALLEEEYNELRELTVDQLFETGHCEVHTVDGPQDPEDLTPLDLPPWPPHRDLIKAQRTQVQEDGRLKVFRTVVPYSGNEFLYQRSDEISWLLTRIHVLRNQ